MSFSQQAWKELFSYTGDCQVVSPQLIMFLKVVTCTLADTMPFKCKSHIQTQHRMLSLVAKRYCVAFQPKVDKNSYKLVVISIILMQPISIILDETTPKLARAKLRFVGLPGMEKA